MPVRLTIHLPFRPARVVELPEGREAVVGREPRCDVVLDDERVSRRHARLAPAGDGWTIADLGSKNGTAVDGHPVGRTRGGPGGPGDPCEQLPESGWVSFGGLLARFERLTEEGRAAAAEERLRRLRTSLELQRGLDPSAGLQGLLERLLSSALTLCDAERGMVLLREPDGRLEVAARAGLGSEDLAAPELGGGIRGMGGMGGMGSMGAIERALDSGRPVATSDAQGDAFLAGRPSVVEGGIRALLALPIRALDRLIGALYADSRKPGAVFTELDLEILEALASQAGMAIAVARLDRELHRLADLASDSEAATGVGR